MQVSNPQPEATVSFYNLKPNKEYQFRVIAINSHGVSEPSPESDFLTTLGALRVVSLSGLRGFVQRGCVWRS